VNATARVVSVGTAVAPHRLVQSDARAFAEGFFARDVQGLERLLRAFENTGIEERQLANELSWYREPHGFPEKNACYERMTLELSLRACERAIERSGIPRERLGGVVFVSTTGIATPSIDSILVQRLDLPRNIRRVPIWGLGCAGGAAGLAIAASLVRGDARPVLLVAAEICSTTFVHGDRSKANLIATALFGDGAAAAVIAPADKGLEVLCGHSQLLDGTADVMGWTLGSEGLQVRFAKSIPSIVHEVGPDLLATALHRAGCAHEQVEHVLVHPGGAKVLRAYEEALGVSHDRLRHAWDVLRAHGNMSSVTVLFVLERFLAEVAPTGGVGVVLGLGPGFSAEAVVVRW